MVVIVNIQMNIIALRKEGRH